MDRRISRASAAAAAASKSVDKAAVDKAAVDKVAVDKAAVDKVSVDKVAVATKHPGVFMATLELEEETGTKLKVTDEKKEAASDEPTAVEETSDDGKEKKEASGEKSGRKEKSEKAAEETAAGEINEVKLEKVEDKEKEKAEATEASDCSEKSEEESLSSRPQRERKRSQGSLPTTEITETTETPCKAAKRRKISATEVAVSDPPPALPEPEEMEDKPAHPVEVEVARLDTIEEQTETEPANAESTDTAEESKAEDKAPSSPTVTRSSISTRRSRKLQVEAEQAVLEAPCRDALQASGSVGPDDLSDNESVSSGVREDVESVDSSGSAPMATRVTRGGKKPRDLRVRVQAKGRGKTTKGKGTTQTANNATNIKGKSRRSIFKRSATKAPTAVARAVTSDRVLYRGQYFTKGDIVSVTDVDGGIFFAQLRGFLTDQYCEKSCVITWLLPTTNSPRPEDGFDPATYIIGPEEELPRKLEFFTFVMHAPDNYFYYRNAPYPTKSLCADQEYVLTRMGPKIRVVNDGKECYRNA